MRRGFLEAVQEIFQIGIPFRALLWQEKLGVLWTLVGKYDHGGMSGEVFRAAEICGIYQGREGGDIKVLRWTVIILQGLD